MRPAREARVGVSSASRWSRPRWTHSERLTKLHPDGLEVTTQLLVDVLSLAQGSHVQEVVPAPSCPFPRRDVQKCRVNGQKRDVVSCVTHESLPRLICFLLFPPATGVQDSAYILPQVRHLAPTAAALADRHRVLTPAVASVAPLAPRREEDVVRGHHGRNRAHLRRTTELFRLEQGSSEHGVHWQPRHALPATARASSSIMRNIGHWHPSTEVSPSLPPPALISSDRSHIGYSPHRICQTPHGIQSAQRIKHLQSTEERGAGWGVKEVEVEHVVDSHGFELEDDGAKVGPQYLWRCGLHRLGLDTRIKTDITCDGGPLPHLSGSTGHPLWTASTF